MKFILLALLVVGVSLADSTDQKPLDGTQITMPIELCEPLKKLTEKFKPTSIRELVKFIMDTWANGGDCMTLDQFTTMWLDLGLTDDPVIINEAFNFFDTDGNGCIDRKEWFRGLRKLKTRCRRVW